MSNRRTNHEEGVATQKERSPVIVAILNSFLQARQAHQLEAHQTRLRIALEQEKLKETLVLDAIESNDPQERKKSLTFFVDVGLLADPEGKIKAISADKIPRGPRGKFSKSIGFSDMIDHGQAIVFTTGAVPRSDRAAAENTSAPKVNKSATPLDQAAGKQVKIEPRLKDIIMEQLGVSSERVVQTASLTSDLGADSMDRLEIMMAIEAEFRITIPDEDCARIETVGDAITYITDHTPQQ